MTGTLGATDVEGDTVLAYGISGGTTGGSTTINSVTYDVSKVGSDGTLYVRSSDGAYAYVPNAAAINALEAATTPDSFTVTASDFGATGSGTLTVNIQSSGFVANYTIAAGQTKTGTIATAGQNDGYAITLTAGTHYVFQDYGNASSGITHGGGTITDTYLRLVGPTGTLIANDDDTAAPGYYYWNGSAYVTDGGASYDSQIKYTATADGTYYLGALGFGSQTGSYSLKVFTMPADPALAPVAENTADPTGESVAQLFSASAPTEIAVLGNSVAADHGAWQYSLDAGHSWTAIGHDVSDSAALVLAPDALLRFLPSAGWSGTPDELWVGESHNHLGDSGAIVDLTPIGGGPALTIDVVSTSVTPLPEAGGDRALGLDGSAHVEIANAGALKATSAVTLESWVQLAATSGILVDTLSNNAGYRLGIDADGHLQFTIGNGTATTTLSSSGASLADGGWHHLAASYDGSALHLYVDGGDVADAAGVGAGALGASSAASLKLGTGLTGALNDLSIWSVARSQGQIASDLTHSLAGNENGLAGYWKFDEAGGTVANASSPGTPDGTILGGASHLDLSTTVQAAANASVFKGMILGFDAADQSLSYAAANNGDTAFGHVAFSGNTFVYTPTSGHITHDDSFTVAITDADAHTVNHSVTVHPV